MLNQLDLLVPAAPAAPKPIQPAIPAVTATLDQETCHRPTTEPVAQPEMQAAYGQCHRCGDPLEQPGLDMSLCAQCGWVQSL